MALRVLWWVILHKFLDLILDLQSFSTFHGPRFGHDHRMAPTHSLIDLYRFPGFVPQPRVEVHTDDPRSIVVTLYSRRC